MEVARLFLRLVTLGTRNAKSKLLKLFDGNQILKKILICLMPFHLISPHCTSFEKSLKGFQRIYKPSRLKSMLLQKRSFFSQLNSWEPKNRMSGGTMVWKSLEFEHWQIVNKNWCGPKKWLILRCCVGWKKKSGKFKPTTLNKIIRLQGRKIGHCLVQLLGLEASMGIDVHQPLQKDNSTSINGTMLLNRLRIPRICKHHEMLLVISCKMMKLSCKFEGWAHSGKCSLQYPKGQTKMIQLPQTTCQKGHVMRILFFHPLCCDASHVSLFRAVLWCSSFFSSGNVAHQTSGSGQWRAAPFATHHRRRSARPGSNRFSWPPNYSILIWPSDVSQRFDINVSELAAMTLCSFCERPSCLTSKCSMVPM